MSVKHYGMYVAWAPTADLRGEGLGRYLAHFLKGAHDHLDVHFTIVCPSWSRATLEELFVSEGVAQQRLNVLAPEGMPYLLRLFTAIQKYKRRKRKTPWYRRVQMAAAAVKARWLDRLERRAVAIHGPISLLMFLVESVPALLFVGLVFPLWFIFFVGEEIFRLTKYLPLNGVKTNCGKFLGRVSAVSSRPQDDGLVLRLFASMQAAELARMSQLIQRLDRVVAWYCPAAFWPEFNNIQAPRLMCVPDVVLTDFPVGFSSVGGDRFLGTFETIRRSIRGADHVVTYSEAVKWGTLVDRYGVNSDQIAVVHHAPNDLSRWIEVSGLSDAEVASTRYCWSLIGRALQQCESAGSVANFQNTEFKFIFYASQFRPNKNILSLLRAYEWLLRRRYVSHKLILTGDPGSMPEIAAFLREHDLQSDVLCLHGLSVQALAACYKLADLAVNPSLSEGGCPFTFAEALSVNTPVLMARIPVSEEVLHEAEVQDVTFFDPYDWKNIAERIEWALSHRDELLAVQLPVYRRLKQRTWTDVASEHLALLDGMIANKMKV